LFGPAIDYGANSGERHHGEREVMLGEKHKTRRFLFGLGEQQIGFVDAATLTLRQQGGKIVVEYKDRL